MEHLWWLLLTLTLLIYINDLSNDLKSESKLFADDTSLFSVVHDINISAGYLYANLEAINHWAFQNEL